MSNSELILQHALPMSKTKPPVQMDVAKLAGVSSATVSRVLNKSNLVKPEIRARVEQAIQELGYFPNAAARTLASKKTRTLGAIIPTLNNAIFAEGVNSFERVARKMDYTLLLSVSNFDLDEEQTIVSKMLERGVDGLILIGNDHHASTLQLLNDAGMRHICVWAHQPNVSAPNIGFSNAEAMSELIDHLVATGHSKIAMLSGITKNNDRARERLNGVKTRLNYHGLSLPHDRVIEVPYSIRSAREQLPALLKHAPTAIVCGNDVIAFGAVLEAKAMKIAIPEELAITGFDNLSLSAEFDPGITTVDVFADQMGEHSARALISAIETGTKVQSHCLETRLIIRETTLKPGLTHGSNA